VRVGHRPGHGVAGVVPAELAVEQAGHAVVEALVVEEHLDR
jgi:hypothetical protein